MSGAARLNGGLQINIKKSSTLAVGRVTVSDTPIERQDSTICYRGGSSVAAWRMSELEHLAIFSGDIKI